MYCIIYTYFCLETSKVVFIQYKIHETHLNTKSYYVVNILYNTLIVHTGYKIDQCSKTFELVNILHSTYHIE